jgi:GNAT superfamily N-acetyltransferase
LERVLRAFGFWNAAAMSLVIRQAVPGDEQLVFGYIRKLADYEKLLHEVEATVEDIREGLFGANPRAFCDLAYWNNEPAGFALWFYNYSTFRGRAGIYLEDLFVDKAMRGKGIGKSLLQHLAKRCVAEGLPRLQWWVLDWNVPSIDFYKSLGAEPQNEWTVYRVSGDALNKLAIT